MPEKQLPQMDTFELIDLKNDRVEELMTLYQNEWWTYSRTREETLEMLLNTSIKIGVIDKNNNALAGFTRVLTDTIFKAFIFDVIVKPDYRGKGLGQMLVDAVIRHPRLKKVQHFELYCHPEMISFYQQYGFEFIGDSMCLMRKKPTV